MNEKQYSEFSRYLNEARVMAWLYMCNQDEYYIDQYEIAIDKMTKALNNKEGLE
jgi:hypothetical protein